MAPPPVQTQLAATLLNGFCCQQGYVLYSYRKKLKAELVGKSPAEIKELRESGIEVTDTYQVLGGLFINCSH